MKFCSECKIGVSKINENCPLCGSYVKENAAPETFLPGYATGVEPYVSYPDLGKVKAVNTFLQTGLFRILLIVMAICTAINLLIGGYFWASHVINSGFMLYVCVIMAIYKNRRVYVQTCVSVIMLSLYLLVTDLLLPGGFGGFSLLYGIPGIILCGIVYTDVMIAIKPKSTRGYYSSLMVLSCLALMPQIVVWALDLTHGFVWLTFGMFFFSIANYCVVCFTCWHYMISEYKRKFHF